jgi:dipeptidyl aminopeptidase/acylaminoacyl peptidase
MSVKEAGKLQSRSFTPEDDIGLSHFGDPYELQVEPITFSPDGKYFVVDTERGLLDKNRPESTLRFYRTEDVLQFLSRPSSADELSPMWTLRKSTYKDGPVITHLLWLADSSGVAFLAKATNGNEQLFIADVKSRTSRESTPESEDVLGFDVRDRDHFVYAVRGPIDNQDEEGPIVGTGQSIAILLLPDRLKEKGHLPGILWANLDGKHFRVKNRLPTPSLPLYWEGVRMLALSPDGRTVVTALPVSSIPREWESLYAPPVPYSPNRIKAGRQDLEAKWPGSYVSEYVTIDLSSGDVTWLTQAPIGQLAGWDSAIAASWSADSQEVLLSNTFMRPDANRPKELQNRPCTAILNLADHSMTCLEHTKGRTKDGFEEDWHYVTDVRFADGSNREATIRYFRQDGSRGSTTYLRSGQSWKAADAEIEKPLPRRLDVSVKEGRNDPPVLVATDNVTKSSSVILDPNPQLKGIKLGEVSILRWKDSSGRDRSGGLLKPPDYVAGRRYPLVIQTHGFAENEFRPMGVFPTAFAAQELGAAGIVVLQVQDCPPTNNPQEGPCNVASYEGAVRRLAADGLVDPDRVGIVGFSRSCYYVLEALTTSELHYKAASITDGVDEGYYSYLTFIGNDNRGTADSDAVIGAPPIGEGLQLWLKRSPEFNMDKVAAPLQVVASSRFNLLVMWGSYAALRIRNKPVDLIMLRGGTHIMRNPAERLASQMGTIDWMRYWLQNYEDPDPTKAKQYARWRELRKLQEANDCVENTYRWVEGTYRNPALGYSIEIPRDLKATTGDQAGPERGLTSSLPSGGKIVVFGEPNSLEWKTPVEGVQAALRREECPSGRQEVTPARVGTLTGAKGGLVCADRVVKLLLAFRTDGGPMYWLRLDTHRAFASKDGTVLENIAASLNLIPWK